MKATIFLSAFLASCTTLYAQNYEWARAFGGREGTCIAVDALGNVYSTGFFFGTEDFDPGPGTTNLTAPSSASEIFVQKLDSSGNFIWAKAFGGYGSDKAQSICVDDSGNVYTTGFFTQTTDFDPGPDTFNLTPVAYLDVFVQKMDASGNFLWAIAFGGIDYDEGVSINVDGSGNVYTAGRFLGTLDFDPGPGTAYLPTFGNFDSFLQKMDASGNFLWAKTFGNWSSNNDHVESISVDDSGNVYTTGYFTGTMDFDPGSETVNLTSVGGNDIFVQKFDASGNLIWAKAFGGASWDTGKSISLDASGNAYISGHFSGTGDFEPGLGTTILTSTGGSDIFVLKIDTSGNFLWAKAFGGIDDDECASVSADYAGNVYTTGKFVGTTDFDPGAGTAYHFAADPDIFVQKMDASGNFLWAKTFGPGGEDYGRSICVDTLGNAYLTGWFQGTVDFDPGPETTNLTAQQGADVFVMKIAKGAEVNGYVFLDTNGNGVKDSGEVPVLGQSVVYGNGNDVANTDSNGFFRAFPSIGAHVFNYVAPPYYISTTPVSQNVDVQLNVIDTLYFGLQPIPDIYDLKVQIHQSTFPRPGFSRYCQLSYQNVGTTN